MSGRHDKPGAGWLAWGLGALLLCAAPAAAAGEIVRTITWPWAWWALLAAMAVVGLILIALRAIGYKALNPIWRGLIVSVLLHAGLTGAMSLVAISQPVLEYLIEGEPDVTSVNLVVGSEADLRNQVRYQVTDLPVEDPSLAALMRAGPQAIRTPPLEPMELSAPPARPRSEVEALTVDDKPVPPAVPDRVVPHPPRQVSDVSAEAVLLRRPVKDVEPRAPAVTSPPDQAPARAARTEPPRASWREARLLAPAARLPLQSVAAQADRQRSPLPTPRDVLLEVATASHAPRVEPPPTAAAVQETEQGPRPVRPAPARPLLPRPLGEVDSPERPRSLTPPTARPAVHSIVAAAPAVRSPVPQPVQAASDAPSPEALAAVELPAETSPLEAAERGPASAVVVPAWPLPPQPLRELKTTPQPRSDTPPAVRPVVRSMVAEAAVSPPVPKPEEAAIELATVRADPEVAQPRPAPPVRATERGPALATMTPARAVAMKPPPPAEPPRPSEGLSPPAPLSRAESIVAAAPAGRPALPPPQPEALNLPAPAASPTLQPPKAISPLRAAEWAPQSPAMRPAPVLAARPVPTMGLPRPPQSLTRRQRISPSDPAGASLRSHLVAEFRLPLVGEAVHEPVRLEPAVTSLGALASRELTIVEPLTYRAPAQRKRLVERMGGSEGSESAVTTALAWLARNQEPDGRWTYIDEDNDRPGRRAANRDDVGLTGLATLCFLAADHRPNKPSEYHKTITTGLEYLLSRQKADGDLRDGGDMYSHAIAALALGEAAVMTRDPKYGVGAFKAAAFIVKAQNTLTGGWRYTPGENGDTSMFGWQIMALYSVQRMGVKIPAETRSRALYWLRGVTRSRYGMLVGYQTSNHTRTMTAEALFARLLLGERPTAEQCGEVIDYLQPPDALETPDYYYWYYGSLAMMQLQNDAWRQWNARVRDHLTEIQQTAGRDAGSWDARQSRWGAERGGRIYATALATLTLQVYYRYLPMYRPDVEARTEVAAE